LVTSRLEALAILCGESGISEDDRDGVVDVFKAQKARRIEF
jgi:hypothetical protein